MRKAHLWSGKQTALSGPLQVDRHKWTTLTARVVSFSSHSLRSRLELSDAKGMSNIDMDGTPLGRMGRYQVITYLNLGIITYKKGDEWVPPFLTLMS